MAGGGGSRVNPTLFDKLTAGTMPSGLEGPPGTTLRYALPSLDRFNERALRSTVEREVGWILNTTQLGSAIDLDGLEQVESSVVNYGVPDLSGKATSHHAVVQRARDIRTALRVFEPRLDEQSLMVEAQESAERENAATYVIHGDIVSAVQPVPIRFKTDVEADGGTVTVRE